MDKLDNLAKESLDRYFHTLSIYGYASYQSVYKEILLLFIEDLLSGPMSLYINEKDYRSISNVLYCLFGSTCLIPYPEFAVTTSLDQILNHGINRMSENGNLRINEHGAIRLLEDYNTNVNKASIIVNPIAEYVIGYIQPKPIIGKLCQKD